MLSARERVLCAINHEEPDRVPIFFGTSSPTTMLSVAYERFKQYLGVEHPPRLLSKVFQYAQLDDDVMDRCGSDGRLISPRPMPAVVRREISETKLIDDWGVTWEQRPGIPYYEVKDVPLRDATIDDLETYAWPDLSHPDRFAGLANEARAMHENTPYAVIALGYLTTFEQMQLLRGLDQWLMDMAADPEFAHALMRKLTDVMLAGTCRYLDEVGPYIDLITFSDDLGTQRAPLISPKMYREMVKPYQAEIIAAIKERTKAKVFFHSCGNIYPLIGDLIEIGVDVLNPVQVSAGEMGDTARLKREFGDLITFCGAIDTGHVLPYGTSDDVRAEVRRRISDLAPGGGYILAAVHCIQPDVPPENVVAMFDEAMVAGKYPIRL
ncbi:MAG TPA: uroporphyrinogen decarboxylase family protein [Anaerolineae bacterium]|nr:uroporphyrinogen decarboxylase family protein [Anaerolineae bacterium]